MSMAGTPVALQLIDIIGHEMEGNGSLLRGDFTLKLKAGDSLILPVKVRVWDSKLQDHIAAVVLRTPGALGLAITVEKSGDAELLILDYAKAEKVDSMPNQVLKNTKLDKLDDMQAAFMPMLVAAYRSPAPGKPWEKASIGVAALL